MVVVVVVSSVDEVQGTATATSVATRTKRDLRVIGQRCHFLARSLEGVLDRSSPPLPTILQVTATAAPPSK